MLAINFCYYTWNPVDFYSFQLESEFTTLIDFLGVYQAKLRHHIAYSYYKRLQKAALVSQCGWRQRVARRELRKLKMVKSNQIPYFLKKIV